MSAVHHLLEPIAHQAPFWRLVEAFRDGSGAGPALLDSSLPDDRLGRFSYLGAGGIDSFEARRRPDGRADVVLTAPDGTRRLAGVDPFDALRDWRRGWGVCEDVLRDTPFPFRHGAIGWIGYEAGHCLEKYPDTGRDDLGLPDLRFDRHEALLVHDHRDGGTRLSVLGRGRDEAAARLETARIREATLARLSGWNPDGRRLPAPPTTAAPDPRTVTDAAREDYLARIAVIRRDIRDGRVFECCLTRRLAMELKAEPWHLYAALRAANPAPFAAWLTCGDAAVACSSPERFLSLDRDGRLETRPIKGTRPRGGDQDDDLRLRDELAASVKDRAENLMIVDLARSDLGRVCETGSVEVPELMAVEGYATVWQMVSTVRGRLRAGLDGIDAVRACFPGGSMTGAPKIEAMKMIDELEPEARGIYAGAAGWLDASGTLDLNIVIRTIVARAGRAVFGVGGAVTADSDPAAEWRETLDKAAALNNAVAAANAQIAG